MNILLISYDLGLPESRKDYSQLITAIRELGQCVKPLKSFWIVKTNHSAHAVYEYLLQFLDPNDHVLVLNATIHDRQGRLNSEIARAVSQF